MALGKERLAEGGVGATYAQRVVRSFAWQGGAQLVGQLCTWVSTLIVIRLLVPSDYGLMSMAGVFLALFFIL